MRELPTTSPLARRVQSLAAATAALALLVAAGPPRHAGRREAPPGIDARAIEVGARAPPLELPTADGARWSLAEALARGPAVLVFYRGHW
jgi:hypothetical protein